MNYEPIFNQMTDRPVSS